MTITVNEIIKRSNKCFRDFSRIWWWWHGEVIKAVLWILIGSSET